MPESVFGASSTPTAGGGPNRRSLAIAGDDDAVFPKIRGPIDEAKVGSPVEHIRVEGDVSLDKFRHSFYNICGGKI